MRVGDGTPAPGLKLPGAGASSAGVPSAGVPGSATPTGENDRLRKAARQLEGVFTEQLFKAMRATVPEDQGVVGGGNAQDMFTGLLDEHLASDPRASSTHGIGEAIYQHLIRTRGAPSAPDAASPAPNAVTPPGSGASLRHSS